MKPVSLRIAGTLGVLTLVAGGVVSGCSSTDKPAASAPPTPIARLNTAALSIPRIEFCSRVPAAAVADALRSKSSRLAAYHDGDKTAVAGGTDTVAENGCAWVATDGAALARAWVFSSAVDRSLARAALKDARGEQGCHLVRSPAFGSPSLTQVCSTNGSVRVRHAGLFGSTWLSCEVSDQAAAAEVRRRADAWCVQIANTLNTSR